MKTELEKKLVQAKRRVAEAIIKIDITGKESEIEMLKGLSSKENFWADQENAKLVMLKFNNLRQAIEPWQKLERELTALINFLEESGEDPELISEISQQYVVLEETLKKHENEIYFNGRYDFLNAVVSVYAGAGGVDAQDWSEMVLSMLLKYCNLHDLKTNIISISEGAETGIKSVSFEVLGPFSYGRLKSERGVHRLVRISPFDAAKARHTSFSLVEVIPEIEAQKLNLSEADVKIETFKASGHGGQSVNTTDSAVRITHLPTRTTVTVQNERSQLQNKDKALQILKSRLKAQAESERDKELRIIRGDSIANEWGSQIRSYVLHPYQMVKDHRTEEETSDVQGVLEGKIDSFVDAYLKSK